MKIFALLIGGILTSSMSFSQVSGVTIPQDASPKAMVEQSFGLSTINISYSRPSVTSTRGEDRTGKIWGEMVPFGMSPALEGFGSGRDFPWRAGANENTVITFSHDAKIEGKTLKAGAYGLHIILSKDSMATVIFSSNTSSWGSYFYDEKEDVLRVDIKTRENDFTERLTYDFVDITDEGLTVVLDWELRRFPFSVSFDKDEIIYANMLNELRGSQGFGWEPPYNAANFCIEREIHLDQAEKWIERSLADEENFENLYAKSELLDKQGKNEEAESFRKKALESPGVTAMNYYFSGQSILRKYTSAEKEEEKKKYASKALDHYKTAIKKWSDNVFLNYGIALAYSANEDYKNAIKALQNGIENTDNEGTVGFFNGLIETLKSGESIN